MKLSTRRLTSMMVAAALVATLAATTTTSAFAKKPGGDGEKPKTDFTITMELVRPGLLWPPAPFAGSFRASGAIKDRGFAIQTPDEIDLDGKKGTINILLVDPVWTSVGWFESHMDALFVIVGGTGDYEGLEGEGFASGDYWQGEIGDDVGALTLQGSVTSP